MPEALVDQAVAAGADFLALTDRDGLYGAVKHVRACAAAAIRPGLGADLAFHDDEHRPLGRVTLLAHGGPTIACLACSSPKLGMFSRPSTATTATTATTKPLCEKVATRSPRARLPRNQTPRFCS